MAMEASVVRIAPGAHVRRHRGREGRLVATLGVRVPTNNATLTVAGETRSWVEGNFLVFGDDTLRHAQAHSATSPTVFLQITVPEQPSPVPSPPSPVATITAPTFRIAVYANCTAQTTLLADGRVSALQPLVSLYNRVADNNARDLDPCVAAMAVPGQNGQNGQSNTVRLTASHGYGSIDLAWKVHPSWVTFELSDLSQWHGDPTEKHVQVCAVMYQPNP